MSDVKKKLELAVTEALMNAHGWERGAPYSNAEWDPNNKDSQYAMMYEDAELAVATVLETITTLSDEEQYQEETEYVFAPIDDEDEEEEDEEEESLFDEYGHIKRKETVTTTNATFIFMDAGTGNPRYVSDVREWLKRVDTAGIPNNTEIEGTLHLSYDVEAENIERIECMECGYKDMLVTSHTCSTHHA